MDVGFEQIFLMASGPVSQVADVFDTYAYRWYSTRSVQLCHGCWIVQIGCRTHTGCFSKPCSQEVRGGGTLLIWIIS